MEDKEDLDSTQNKDASKQPSVPANEGQDSMSGSTPITTSDDDVEEAVEDVIGNKPDTSKPFSLAEEVEKDEKAKHDIPPDESDLEGAVEDEDKFSDK